MSAAADPTPAAPATAAGERALRYRAAAALAQAERRAQLAWNDLPAWPVWTESPAAERDAWLWRLGVYCEASALRRCIEGRVVRHLAERLGAAQLKHMLETAPDAGRSPPEAWTNRWDPPAADAAWIAAGRECALAAVPSAVLRVILRERLWPGTTPPVPAMNTALAQQAVRAIPYDAGGREAAIDPAPKKP